MASSSSRGRGRGTTLPAWMTRKDVNFTASDNSIGQSSDISNAGINSTNEPRFRSSREQLPLAADDNLNGGRRDDSELRDRSRANRRSLYDSRDYDNGNPRGQHRDAPREQSDYREKRERDYKFSSDRYHGVPERMRAGSDRGLGYTSIGTVDNISWERDRAEAWGTYSQKEEVQFLKGGTLDDGREIKDSQSVMARGRGRGRGRGNINCSSWMTNADSTLTRKQEDDEPSKATIKTTSAQEEKNKETMELLLTQARQVQQEQLRQKQHITQKDLPSQSGTTATDQHFSKTDEEKKKQISQKELMIQRRIETEKAAQDAVKEQERLERLRYEEEERQLRALMGDSSDNENSIGESTPTDFETIKEREERLAQKRREERRKRFKLIEESTTEDEVKVDNPRNPNGVIQSERESKTVIYEKSVLNHAEIETHSNHSISHICTEEQHNTVENVNGDESFDIFVTGNPTPIPIHSINYTNSTRSSHAQECDDPEGYYKASIGEVITLPKNRGDDVGIRGVENEADLFLRFRVMGIIGKGVFSTVIKCVEESNIQPSNNDETGESGGRIVAIKIIRNNEVMAKAAAKEMRILRLLCQPRVKMNKTSKKNCDNGRSNNMADDEEDADEKERRERENHNIVRLLEMDPLESSIPNDSAYSTSSYAAPPLEYRSHCVFLFEFLPYNLREVLSKFGKNVGITLTAVRSYARQLLCALAHLERHRIVHADLKPDNILVSANFSTVKLADFGSAFFETDHDNDPTPYLVSRFYRPPEVILGLEYDRMVDLWSTSVTLAELFTGSVLFPGNTNNDMLLKFMDSLGPFSHKMIRRHAASYTKMGLIPHFEVGLTGGTYRFCRQDTDRITGQPVVRMVNVLSAKTDARLTQVLLRASKVGSGSASERVEVLKFADLLSRCLALDPARRLSVRDVLKHEFFSKKKRKEGIKE